MTRRAVAAGLVLLCLSGCGERRDEEAVATSAILSAVPDAGDLIERLSQNPAHLPADVPPTTPTVVLLVGFDERGVHPDGPPIATAGHSLRFERALVSRRTTAPAYWVLQTESDDRSYRYWLPVDPTPKIRVDVPDDDPDPDHTGGLVQLNEMYVAMRLPFFQNGLVVFFTPEGREVGRYRFGEGPTTPLTQVAG